ncbi:MAG: hypothetical protein GC138_00485 [Gammaproteobacteria bacterium]|nr:hypothetical protein [Gammaproteobacteria bacterium]
MTERFDDAQLTRYSRHFLLKGFGESEQAALRSARVLLIGLGGLGGVAALYLAAAGVGDLTVCDHDAVELSNLQRQIIYGDADLGTAKTEAARSRLEGLNPDVLVRTIDQRLNGDRLVDAIEHADLIVDASDNFETRYALNRTCFRVGKPLVYGAAIGTAGQAAVFVPGNGTGCLQCLFDPEQDDPERDCHSAGVFAPLTGIVGSIMAGEAIKVLTGFGTSLAEHLLTLDARDMRMRRTLRPREPGCPICGTGG